MTRVLPLAAALLLSLALLPLSSIGGRAQGLDLDQVFRCVSSDDAGIADCREARDLILNNCTTCHTFVPIVLQGFDDDGWTGLLDRHVEGGRIRQLSAEQVAAIHAYLTANFDGSLPPPDLPPELLSTWTSY